MDNGDELYKARFAAAAEALRGSGALGRSPALVKLFTFLADCSLQDRAPKEIEIAQEVFGQASDFDMMQDASVRVHIHRLRRKLDDYADELPVGSDILTLPRGQYRLQLVAKDGAIADEPEPDAPVAAGDALKSGLGFSRPLLAILLLAALLNILAWWLIAHRQSTAPSAQVAQSRLWANLRDTARPLYIVAGDVYAFGELDRASKITRIIHDPAINSSADLDKYLMQHPEEMARYADLDLSYLPVSIAAAMRNVFPVLSTVASPQAPRVISASQLSGETMRTSNMVYIGQLRGLGVLTDPLFTYSGFQLSADADELIDRASGRRYRSDWDIVAKGGKPQRDYGYITGLTAPSGNRVLVIAGTHDAAVVQMTRILTDQARLDQLTAHLKERGRFEALYEVRASGNYDLASRLILVRSLPDGPGGPTPAGG